MEMRPKKNPIQYPLKRGVYCTGQRKKTPQLANLPDGLGYKRCAKTIEVKWVPALLVTSNLLNSY